ncbi:RCC1 domain-containing protein [Legionella sp. CNM-1927-20]|uniref:RCC1 domain-containing protein n=1 Tax=Legionella sp. CNM-1927-20 TaxID=3422221 RepID=UPI00403A7CA7
MNKELKQLVDDYLKTTLKVKQLACGQNYSLILLQGGRVLAMGCNKQGQLGLQDNNDRFSPTEIIGLEPIEYLSVGFSHSILLSKENRIWLTGNNSDRQLALNNQTSQELTLQKALTPNLVKNVVAADFTTAYLDVNGIVYSYGIDKLKPHFVQGYLKLLPDWVKIPNNLNVIDISVGKEHALLLTSEGFVYGFGSNKEGLLGLGTDLTYCKNWTLLSVVQAIKVKATALGSLILTTQKELIAAGINSAQQFSPSENLIFTSFTTIAVDIINFDAHDFHTLYQDSSQQLYLLGFDYQNQLKLRRSHSGREPVPIPLIGFAPEKVSLEAPTNPTRVQSSKQYFSSFFQLKDSSYKVKEELWPEPEEISWDLEPHY